MEPSPDEPAAKPRPLTLRRLMGAVAASAVFFALFPPSFAATLAITVCGVVLLEGMRLPIVTEGDGARRWLPWVAWLLILLACPIATEVVAARYPHAGPPSGWPWATHVVQGLFGGQIAVSAMAAIAVVVLARGLWRWMAWAVILAIGAMAALQNLIATMTTSGYYL